jgi:hypothetical protein
MVTMVYSLRSAFWPTSATLCSAYVVGVVKMPPSWLLLEKTRQEADTLLQGGSDGTFLVRQTNTAGAYALGVVYKNKVGEWLLF